MPPTHPVNFTRRIACDLSEGVGRDSTCIVIVDDWGVLEVVLGNSMGLPEAAETIHRLAAKWNVPHDKISFDKLGIGRNFPNHLARWGITMAIPFAGGAGHKTQAHSSTCAPRPVGSCTIGWTSPILDFGMPILDCRMRNADRVQSKIQNPQSKIAWRHSGRFTFALARTMSGWSMSCGH